MMETHFCGLAATVTAHCCILKRLCPVTIQPESRNETQILSDIKIGHLLELSFTAERSIIFDQTRYHENALLWTGRQEATYRVTRRSTNEESSLFRRVYVVFCFRSDLSRQSDLP